MSIAWWHRFSAPTGVRQIKIHDTRRTCGSLLAALDVHPRVAMAILRHSRIALTMDIYTQVPDKATREALQRLSDLLDDHQGDGAAPAGDEGEVPEASLGAISRHLPRDIIVYLPVKEARGVQRVNQNCPEMLGFLRDYVNTRLTGLP
jgi:hypothetical protein